MWNTRWFETFVYNLNKADGYIEDSNGNKYLTSFPTDEVNTKWKSIKKHKVKLSILFT